MSITVPFRTPHQPVPDAAAAPPSVDEIALGRLRLRSLTAYLLLWTVVLFAVEVLVLWSSHTALLRLGVLDSVSRAAATLLDEPLPDSGVLPALEFGALLPWLLAAAAGLAVLWLLTVLALVLVHNGICAVTGGPRVHVR
jgi:hypothetical protein